LSWPLDKPIPRFHAYAIHKRNQSSRSQSILSLHAAIQTPTSQTSPPASSRLETTTTPHQQTGGTLSLFVLNRLLRISPQRLISLAFDLSPLSFAETSRLIRSSSTSYTMETQETTTTLRQSLSTAGRSTSFHSAWLREEAELIVLFPSSPGCAGLSFVMEETSLAWWTIERWTTWREWASRCSISQVRGPSWRRSHRSSSTRQREGGNTTEFTSFYASGTPFLNLRKQTIHPLAVVSRADFVSFASTQLGKRMDTRE
jgi:hypothetical protein